VGGRDLAVIDPGPDVESHVRALSRLLSGAKKVTILLTHRHSDHAGGAPALARLVGVPIRAPASYSPPPGSSVEVETLRQGDRISTDEGDLVTLGVPGHSRDHLAFHWREGDALFVGDLLLGKGSTTWVGEYLGCVEDYLRSLDRVEALGVSVMYPGHGPPITRPRAAVDRFRRHRFQRLEEVRQIRERNPGAAPEELAAMIYGGEIPEKLARAAAEGVRAALFHLDREKGSR